MPKIGQYRRHVTHPRYGYAPRVNGNDAPTTDAHGGIHWRYAHETLIPGTAVRADTLIQRSTIPLLHYYDLDKVCADCHRRFIFFALEQKHWYEELGFSVDAKCLRCPECRKREQRFVRLRQRYDLLLKQKRSWAESMDLADTTLSLVEAGAMRLRDFSKIHRFLNEVPEEEHHRLRYKELVKRLERLESWKVADADV
jgi:ssDNA-binding Zn-finger/Zn-ribbon topoisomerase 1